MTGLNQEDVYCYNSSIDSGCITLMKADNMLSIILIQIGLVVFFIMVGLPFKFGFAKFTSWSLALLEIVMTVWMILINETGGDIIYLLVVNSLITLVFGGILGFMAIFMLMAKLSTGTGKKLNDDGYTKFLYD